MLIRYHFIANLLITEMRSIPLLTKYDKLYQKMSKSTLKDRFFRKQLKIKQKTVNIEMDFLIYLISG